MIIEKKLYSSQEVGQIIKNAVDDIAGKLGTIATGATSEKIKIMKQWASELLPTVEDAVAEEIVRRHVQGVVFSVWSGPPGSGKGTNIDTVNLLGKVYAEVASQGSARQLIEPYHTMLLKFSVEEALISTGTKGMFNKPEGEYAELFGGLVPIVGELIAAGGFAPDDVVSALVELMILLRLTQNSHKIQIDLWPRTAPQFDAFQKMVNKIRSAQGKVTTEVVTIKILKPESLEFVRSHLKECADASRKIAARIELFPSEPWYKEIDAKSALIQDMKQKYQVENTALHEALEELSNEFQDQTSQTVIEELRKACERMEFRFNIVIEKGGIPRPDEYPLHVIKRLGIYTGNTSPVFLEAIANNSSSNGYFVVSSAGTPEEVVAEILDTLAQTKSSDEKWKQIKALAGEMARAIVFKKELIVDELIQRVGGIVLS